MIVCPVCEHAQAAGAECEVCGKRLVAGPAGIPAVPTVEGFEPTRMGGPVAEADPPALLDLERTHHDPVDVTVMTVPDVEPTRSPPVDVAAGVRLEVERTEQAGIPDDGPTLLPRVAVCRYCRTEAMPGERVCGRCGMRLPAVESILEPLDASPEAPRDHPCPSCGVPATGARCPACGGRLTSPPSP